MNMGRAGAALLVLALAAGQGEALAQRGQIAPYVDTIQPPYQPPPPPWDPAEKIYPPPARPEPVPRHSTPVPQPYGGEGGFGNRSAPFPQGFTMVQPKGAGKRIEEGARLERARDIPSILGQCWRPPPARTDSEVTVRIAFNGAGALLGEPRVTYVSPGMGATREAVRQSILTALARCAPLRFTPALGSGISGRPFTIRFIAPAGGERL
ncbi:MAG: hypothetical protein JWN93_473 [Hyphomicrobiales bacterium]|nr:hypothetical protein [Hyphomicrobiales bacterium]